MNSPGVFEGVLEDAALDWLGRLGWDIAQDAPATVAAVL